MREYDEVGTLGRKLCGGTTMLAPANARVLEDFSASLMSADQLSWAESVTSTYINLPFMAECHQIIIEIH